MNYAILMQLQWFQIYCFDFFNDFVHDRIKEQFSWKWNINNWLCYVWYLHKKISPLICLISHLAHQFNICNARSVWDKNFFRKSNYFLISILRNDFWMTKSFEANICFFIYVFNEPFSSWKLILSCILSSAEFSIKSITKIDFQILST